MTKLLTNSTFLSVSLLVLLVLVSILVLNYVFTPTMDRVEWAEETYTVKVGDSLWTISGKYCPDSVDCREWIDEVQTLNGMTGSTIHPGQELIVLVPVEEG